MDVIAEKMSIPQYLFKLHGLGDGTEDISGMMLNPLTLGGSNQYTTSGEMVRAAPILSTAIKDAIGAKIEDVTNARGQRMMGGYGKFNKAETRAKWTNSATPQVVCDFTLLANTADDAVLNMQAIQLIKSAVLPINDKGALLAPLGYKGQTGGTLTFSLGTWLVIPKLVMVSETCTPSLQIMSNGYPLYWHCTFTVEPFETITIDDFKRYFQQPTVLGAVTTSKGSDVTDVLQGNLNKGFTGTVS